MFKLVVLSCLFSVAFAGVIHEAPVHHYAQVKTIVEPHYSIVETPTVEHVASVVKSIPTATSHQSQTQYHSKNIVEPIYAHGVEKSYINTPVARSYVEQVPHIVNKVAYSQPIVAKAAYVEAPVAYSSVYAPKALSYASAYQPAYAAYSSYPAAHSAYPAYAQYAHQW